MHLTVTFLRNTHANADVSVKTHFKIIIFLTIKFLRYKDYSY